MVTRSIPEPLRSWSGALALVLFAAGLDACRSERAREDGDGVHDAGFADPESSAFHGTYLRGQGYPLEDCRDCHGDDYRGGSVEVSCVSSSCHSAGVEDCRTCHGSPPPTAGHVAHSSTQTCASCHPTRRDARGAHHPDGTIDVAFDKLASAAGFVPEFDAQGRGCSGVYCHLGKPMQWDSPMPLGCDGCHEAPPAWHAQFVQGPVEDRSSCVACHGSEANHIDGTVETKEVPCDGCHGHGPLGAPPRGLTGGGGDGAIGAHTRHLDPTLVDRIGRVAKCEDCHEVPDSVGAPGHIDAAPPADVELGPGELYDPGSRTCRAACHFSVEPGPRWDDTTGAARACDACHGFPPVKTRTGTTHPPAQSDLDVCTTCHTFDAATHVDGKVDFVW